MSQIHFGYVVVGEWDGEQQVRVLVAASHAGLEAQAHLLGVRLRMEDYVAEYSDLEDYDVENIYDVEHKKCSDSKCIVAGAEYPCVGMDYESVEDLFFNSPQCTCDGKGGLEMHRLDDEYGCQKCYLETLESIPVITDSNGVVCKHSPIVNPDWCSYKTPHQCWKCKTMLKPIGYTESSSWEAIE